jgi:two-component system, NarL family, nitrate/nitrite response regulator NarL
VAESKGAISMLVADDHALFRDAVRAALSVEPGLEIVAEAHNGRETIAAALRARPRVALIDATLPYDAIRATALIVQQLPECRVIVLSDTEDEKILLEAVEAGASGFLTKASPLTILVDTVKRVDAGETLIPSDMLGALLARLVNRRAHQGDAVRRMLRLTPREKEVLGLLGEGADNDAIARALVISPQTARTHVQNIFGKLEVHSRLEAAAFVVTNGLQHLVGGNEEFSK